MTGTKDDMAVLISLLRDAGMDVEAQAVVSLACVPSVPFGLGQEIEDEELPA